MVIRGEALFSTTGTAHTRLERLYSQAESNRILSPSLAWDQSVSTTPLYRIGQVPSRGRQSPNGLIFIFTSALQPPNQWPKTQEPPAVSGPQYSNHRSLRLEP